MSGRAAMPHAVGALLVTALLAAGITQPASASAASGDVTQAFVADSGDACRMGVATGTIVWHLPPGGRAVDGLAGVLDRPVSDDDPQNCADDGRYTILMLTARVAGKVVDREAVEVDNGQRRSSFTLTAAVPIEEVVVQVCRRGRLPGPAPYCGVAQTYRAPLTPVG